jgi:A/G-specific adenine glycosylase
LPVGEQRDGAVEGLPAAVLEWYAGAARDLPWRRPKVSPWAVLVSEVMLQQTPVRRVLPAYGAWMARWPDSRLLAGEPAGAAVRQWGSLGYPRRALHLHATARILSEQHNGMVPTDLAALLALPGVGPYTARAVASFAFGQRHAVVDTNARRVLHRVVRGQVTGSPSPTADLQLAEPLLPVDAARAPRFAVALMELGALICTARRPACEACPLAEMCRWRQRGYPAGPAGRRVTQLYAGTDRQARGRLLAEARGSAEPLSRVDLARTWPEPDQRVGALVGLVADGLLVRNATGRYELPA